MSATTIIVWTLVIVIDGFKAGGPTVVDNISTKQNCEALAQQISTTAFSGYRVVGHRCIAVRKAVTS